MRTVEEDPLEKPLVISSSTRSSRICRKEGNGFCLEIQVFRWP